MDSVAVRHIICVANPGLLGVTKRNKKSKVKHIHLNNNPRKPLRSCFVVSFKKSDFQDFQGYANPSRLLPATEVKEFDNNLQDDPLTSITSAELQSLYKIRLLTSSIYGSSLSNTSATVLLCLIDQNGDSVLQSLPVISGAEPRAKLNGTDDSEVIHFQQGSVDEFIFAGPKLENFEALWISVGSGQWRLGGITLTVIPLLHSSSNEADKENTRYGLQYDFEVEDLLLGEGSDTPMVELRPSQVTELSGDDTNTMLNKDTSNLTPSSNRQLSNEESMKEYSNLKFSLLLYDGMLVTLGSSVAYFAAGENAALAFFIGGIGGFLYLLLLQRSVDELPSAAIMSMNAGGNPGGVFGRLKGPISSLALVSGFAAVGLKYGLGDASMVLTPKDLVVGMLGFLVCKVAVVLAAFKPLEITPLDK